MTKSRRLWLILVLSFMLGIAITVAEPDLQVLASNVPHINTTVLIITVSVGVGLFLVICMLRNLLGYAPLGAARLLRDSLRARRLFRRGFP